MSARPSDVTRHELEDGWIVQVSVPVHEQIGYSGGHVSSGAGVLWTSGSTTDLIAEIEARQAELRADLARTPRLTVDATRHGVRAMVLDEPRSETDPSAILLWPPTVTGAGLVLAWVLDTPSSTEIQSARFVDRSGEVRSLPFELAVRPLAGADDGRLLLPCADPLWWDGRNEPLTWIDLDGATEPLLIDGLEVTPRRICEAVGESWDHESDDFDGPGWEPVQGRRDDDELSVRLLTDTDEGRRWITVAFSLAGSWAVRVVERGDLPSDGPVPPL